MIYIILVNWNGGRDTLECLASIMRSTYQAYRIIIVDNGSDDGSVNQISTWAEAQPATYARYTRAQIEGDQADMLRQRLSAADIKLLVIEAGENLGFGSANNVALRYVMRNDDYEYVWLLNNDTTIGPDTLAMMIATCTQHPGIVGSVIRYQADPKRVQAYGGGFFSPITGRVQTATTKPSRRLDFINGASLMMDRATLGCVGLFDEHIFMYFEENEYCIRAAKQHVAMSLSDASILHKGGGSLAGQGSYFSWKNVYKNKVYVMMKHYGPGVWMLVSGSAWIFNALNLRLDPDRRRAAREALVALFKSMLIRA